MSLFLLSLLLYEELIWFLFCCVFLSDSCTPSYSFMQPSFILFLHTYFTFEIFRPSLISTFNFFFPLINHSLPFNSSWQRTAVLWCYGGPMPLIMHVVKASHFTPCISMKTCIKRIFTHLHTDRHQSKLRFKVHLFFIIKLQDRKSRGGEIARYTDNSTHSLRSL